MICSVVLFDPSVLFFCFFSRYRLKNRFTSCTCLPIMSRTHRMVLPATSNGWSGILYRWKGIGFDRLFDDPFSSAYKLAKFLWHYSAIFHQSLSHVPIATSHQLSLEPKMALRLLAPLVPSTDVVIALTGFNKVRMAWITLKIIRSLFWLHYRTLPEPMELCGWDRLSPTNARYVCFVIVKSRAKLVYILLHIISFPPYFLIPSTWRYDLTSQPPEMRKASITYLSTFNEIPVTSPTALEYLQVSSHCVASLIWDFSL